MIFVLLIPCPFRTTVRQLHRTFRRFLCWHPRKSFRFKDMHHRGHRGTQRDGAASLLWFILYTSLYIPSIHVNTSSALFRTTISSARLTRPKTQDPRPFFWSRLCCSKSVRVRLCLSVFCETTAAVHLNPGYGGPCGWSGESGVRRHCRENGSPCSGCPNRTPTSGTPHAHP